MSSKIPIHRENGHLETKDNMKTAQPLNNPSYRGKQNGTGYKGHLYRSQAQLKDQNRLLETTNNELQRNLSESRDKLIQLEQQYTNLQGENKEVQKRLESCQLLLIAGNIDPVLGEKIGETRQQIGEQRKDVMNLSRDLLNELERFGEKAEDHRAQLKLLQQTMDNLKSDQEQNLQEREKFSFEVEEMERALKKAERLLLDEM